MEQVLGTCADRGIKVVTNAGGLNPAGCADKVRDIATKLGVDRQRRPHRGRRPARPRRRPAPAPRQPRHRRAADRRPGQRQRLPRRLGHRPRPRRRRRRRRVPAGHRRRRRRRPGGVVVGLGTDRLGPPRRRRRRRPRHRVRRPDHRRQLRLLRRARRPRRQPLGFPIAEVDADGSSVITKHPGTGGRVTVDTVTAQLLYEIQSPAYANPDVVTRFDTIRLDEVGPDRVRIAGVRGEPAPPTAKVRHQLRGRLPQQDDVRPHRPRPGGQGRAGPSDALVAAMGGADARATRPGSR